MKEIGDPFKNDNFVFRNIPPSLPPAPPRPAPVNGVGPPVMGPPRLVKIIFLSAHGSVLATSRVLRDSRDGDHLVTRKVGCS